MKISIIVALLTASPVLAHAKLPIEKIKLPPGFQITVLSDQVPGARSLSMSPSGTLYIGTRDQGKVYAIPDATRGKSEVITIATGLHSPNGVVFRDGSLYVAEISRILKFEQIESRLKNPTTPIVLNDRLPKDEHHGWKFIAFGPDGLLYVPQGAPCNICNASPRDERYASITRMKSDGSGQEVVARGIRNTVGFDWQPETHELWFTDNGRDMLGDDLPPDELNHLTQKGQHFGYPFCHGKGISDPEFGAGHDCKGAEFIGPEIELPAHVAALGMRFYTGKMFGPEYLNQVFIAEHGSWNRTKPIGYRVTLARMSSVSHAKKYEVFAEGWLQNDQPWGRPVDVLVTPDGALLVSDDFAGAIYNIMRKKSPGPLF
jgi:glucose/arabinose dehydrogenase